MLTPEIFIYVMFAVFALSLVVGESTECMRKKNQESLLKDMEKCNNDIKHSRIK